MVKRALLSFSLAALTFALAACGGGGGGGGSLGGGSILGGGGNDGGNGGGNDGTTVTPAERTLTAAANQLTSNNYAAAITGFEAVIADPAATPAMKVQAKTGLAVARLSSGSIDAALAALTEDVRAVSDEAAVAYATAAIQKSGVVALGPAVDSLAGAVSGAPDFGSGAVATGITEAQARALLAVMRAMRDDPGDAAAAAEEAGRARGPADADAPAKAILAAYDLLVAP